MTPFVRMLLRECTSDSLQKKRVLTIPGRTTNAVFRCGNFIVKLYNSTRNYDAEVAVYRSAEALGIRVPPLIAHGRCKEQPWMVLRYVPSIQLSDFMLLCNDKNTLLLIAKHIARTIAVFENNAGDIQELGTVRWEVFPSIAPLIRFFAGKASELGSLERVFRRIDHANKTERHAPCFDAYLNNFLIPKDQCFQEFPTLIHIDFDKAFRAVPLGEQLSHFVISESLNTVLTTAINEYADTHGANSEHISKICYQYALPRALSGLRDLVKNIPANRTDRLRMREKALACARIAEEWSPHFAESVKISLSEEEALLGWIKRLPDEISKAYRIHD